MNYLPVNINVVPASTRTANVLVVLFKHVDHHYDLVHMMNWTSLPHDEQVLMFKQMIESAELIRNVNINSTIELLRMVLDNEAHSFAHALCNASDRMPGWAVALVLVVILLCIVAVFFGAAFICAWVTLRNQSECCNPCECIKGRESHIPYLHEYVSRTTAGASAESSDSTQCSRSNVDRQTSASSRVSNADTIMGDAAL